MYHVQVTVNDAVALPFVVDSGAAEVTIPADVARTLVRAGTLTEEDFLPGRTYTLADGSTLRSARVTLRSLRIGPTRLANVTAVIAPPDGSLLLGQSALERLGDWRLDLEKQALVLGGSISSDRERTADTTTSLPDDAARDFVALFMRHVAERDLDGLCEMYATHVDYFGRGVLSREAVRQDKETYFDRWPLVRQHLLGRVTVAAGDGDATELTFSTQFEATSPSRHETSHGVARNVFGLKRVDGVWQIIRERQTILSRAKSAH